jgi:acyl transferase domain-containing protein/acyl carrier protein
MNTSLTGSHHAPIAPPATPIAIVGIGCRFPGGSTGPAGFWRLLRDGVDAIGEVPPDRWSRRRFYDPEPGRPGKITLRHGGFIDGVDRFDAAFFGISPREATRMDPQQRLLLEVAWEALEDAGQPAEALAAPTAVYVGLSSYDYMLMQSGFNRHDVDTYTNTGSALSIAANRISYCLNLKGPSAAVDTACSSALVAVHLACQSLRRGESRVALAGGVNLLLSPDPYIGFSKLSMLSADGRCKAFDARANGFVRSEGGGVVVLKPLPDALRDGDRVYAVIRGTAVNQDGRTPGLTVPSESAQATLLRVACCDAGVDPAEIQVVEAHGTGTPVGDPIEARALGSVLGAGRPADRPCLIGSVKTNIGHPESAAGIAGLIKMALALYHRRVPANLHFETPNPDIPMADLRLRVPRALEPWPAHRGPALAGVNSFGFGGTNAHAILQEAPGQDGQPARNGDAATNGRAASAASCHPATASPCLLPLSARGPESLRALARSVQQLLTSPDAPPLADVLHTACLRRSHHDHRLAVVGSDRDDLAAKLAAFAEGETPAGVLSDRVPPEPLRQVWVFSGQGPQWHAMGRQLLDAEPVYRRVIERCDELLRPLAGWSLLDELRADEAASSVHDTEIAQPALFAVQVALAEVWRSWGLRPDVVVGHSLGELAAAVDAEVLDLEDALRVVVHRSRCVVLARAKGSMLAVGLPEGEVLPLIERYAERVGVAAVNSPRSVTLSGETAALEELAEEFRRRKLFARFLQVPFAFHSPMLELVKDEMLASVAGVRPRPGAVPIVSSVTGRPIDGTEMGPDYWWQNFRLPVRFAAAINHLAAQGPCAVLEISPHPVLGSSVTECFAQAGQRATVLASLRRHEDERAYLLRALGALYTVGHGPDWRRVAPAGRFTPLPSYPWRHERYWHESPESRADRLGEGAHPLLGMRVPSAEPAWVTTFDRINLPPLYDHRAQGRPLVPTTAYVELALAAGRAVRPEGPCRVEELKLLKACFLPEKGGQSVQTSVAAGELRVTLHSRAEASDDAWVEHVRGRLRPLTDAPAGPAFDPAAVQKRCPAALDRAACYERLTRLGLDYGPAFRTLERLWTGVGEALGLVRLPDGATPDDVSTQAVLLDGCLQSVFGTVPDPADADGNRAVFLPAAIDEVRSYRPAGPRLWAHARLAERSRDGITADLSVYDEAGGPVAEWRGIRCQAVGGGAGAGDGLRDLLYEFRWRFEPRPGEGLAGRRFDAVPPLGQVLPATQDEAAQLAAEWRLRERSEVLEPLLADLCAAFIWEAFRDLAGGDFPPAGPFRAEELADRLPIAPQHRRLFGRYLDLLAEDGVTARDGDAWRFVRPPAVAEAKPFWQGLLAKQPAFFAELTLLGRCGSQLAAALRGDVNPLQLIFPEGSLTTAEHLYQDSPGNRFFNTVAREAVGRVLSHLPPGRGLRVLEIGAGTGGLTSYVLPRLPADRTEYVFTDLSQHFFTKAEQKFRAFPFVKYQKLDVERNPLEQGIAEGSFDLVLASQVLHATADLRRTLTHVRQVLADRGVLLMLEAVKPTRWIDLVFGLTEGWWRCCDAELRPNYPLIAFEKWQGLLEDLGYGEVTDASCRSAAENLGSSVILARAPERPAVAPAPAAAPATARWVLLADHQGVAERLATRLRATGDECDLLYPADPARAGANGSAHAAVSPTDAEALRRELEPAAAAAPSGLNVVYLWALDARAGRGDEVEAAETYASLGAVHLARALHQVSDRKPARLWLVTRGVHPVEQADGPAAFPQAPLWGLGRVIRNEFPGLHRCTIDLSAETPDTEIDSLAAELRAAEAAEEVALRGPARYAHRLAHTDYDRPRRPAAGEAPEFRVEVSRLGVFDDLQAKAVPAPAPGPGEVAIEVRAAGLNFSDVMKALGMYPGLPDGPIPLGIECSGVVRAVGEGVSEFRPGDEVVAVAPFSFGTVAITGAPLVAPKPPALAHEEAATLPIAFLTAAYALEHLGRMELGESVLIHSATGGVGLAALQLARAAGAEVFATAGSPEKRQFLQALGVGHVFDSRSPAFADEVMRHTDGRGVDLVLNSLSGELLAKGLACVADHGRFLEIGKRDIYADSQIGLRPFRKNVSFIAIDLDRSVRERALVLGRLFRQVMKRIADGELAPLPLRVFPAGHVAEAFRTMAQAKHIGKVVVSLRDRSVPVAPAAPEPVRFRDDATYLVTGGLGGFGRTVARWLVERGARHLVLLGRRAPTPEAARELAALRELGADVLVRSADVADAEQLAGVLAEIATARPPLRGVFHMAMVLDDCLILNLSPERLRKVFGPKVDGAWHLHQMTRHLPLDHFVLFSSMSSVFGMPGQANYAAANLFLEALAEHRRRTGLPGLAVAWGYLGQVGYVAERAQIAEMFAATGVQPFSPEQALRLLGELMARPVARAGVMRVDWTKSREARGSILGAPRFAGLCSAPDQAAASESSAQGGRAVVLAADRSKRPEVLQGLIREKVARVLGTSAARLDLDKPLTDLGLDSLMAVELRNWVEGELRVNLPIVELMRGPSVNRLAQLLLEQLDGAAPASAAAPAQPLNGHAHGHGHANGNGHTNGNCHAGEIDPVQAGRLLGKLDDLSGEEVDALLKTMANGNGDGR